ncbi:MAG: hypothetical protein FJ398_06265 [Verrucomicrobia bacterium]|nr:hypothetical protein [Verrucomicrobiota bacterium]
MKLTKTLALVSGVSLLLVALAAHAADTAKPGELDRSKKPATATQPATPAKTLTPTTPGVPARKPETSPTTPITLGNTVDPKLIESTIDKALTVNRNQKPARPDHKDKSERSGPSDDVKRLMDLFKETRNEFLEQEKELKQKYTAASKVDREKLRDLIKEKRQAFLDRQKELRDELHKRTQDVRDQLKDHREVIDAAKDQAKDEVNRRKGGRD